MACYKKNVEAIRRFQVNIGENYINVFISGLEHIYKSCIYASISGFFNISS